MLLLTAIEQLRAELRGVESLDISDKELTYYVNRSCFLVNTLLINVAHPSVVKEKVINTGEDYKTVLPNFLRFIGNYPIRFSNGLISVEDDTTSCLVRYYSNVSPLVLAENPELPIPLDFQDIAIMYARISALNRQDMDTEPDQLLLQNTLVALGFIAQPTTEERVGVK